MSAKSIPVPTFVDVCDLCGKPIDTYSGIDRCALNWGTTPLAKTTKPGHFLFLRRRHGERTSGAPKGDYRSWQWDFHGECLVAALEPLVVTDPKP